MNDNIIGQKYSKLYVKSFSHKKGVHKYYVCVCECGNEKVVYKHNITSGHTRSCGCLLKETAIKKAKKLKKHGDSGNRLYRIWRNMKNRCTNPNDKNFHNYGGRGITVCKEWEDSFINFKEWSMNNGYKDNLTIDRINVNGNYEPTNCRWANKSQQSRNTRRNIWLEIDGVKMVASDWAKLKGIPKNTLCRRIKNGVPKDKLFEKGWVKSS